MSTIKMILIKNVYFLGTLYLVIIPIYVAFLLGMAWRASAEKESKNKNKLLPLTKAGGLSFVISGMSPQNNLREFKI